MATAADRIRRRLLTGITEAVLRPPKLPGEFALISRYFAPLSMGFPGAYALQDDVAVISPTAGCELVAKTDTIIGGIDFPELEAADLVARKALRVNLSDLAAKGATPLAYMLDLMLPIGIDEAWVCAFTAGLGQDQLEYGMKLIGGDMSATPWPLTIAVTAFGEIPIGKTIRRGGACAGDSVFATGTIGDAALGLAALRGSLAALEAEQTAFLIDRYRLPRPRGTLGPKLIGIATAALDISDGLVADLHHLCEVSKLAAVIEAEQVPLSGAAAIALAQDPSLLAAVLTGGDDYEILFTARPDAAVAIASLSRSAGLRVTCIGHMHEPLQADPKVTVLGKNGSPLALPSEGWTHF